MKQVKKFKLSKTHKLLIIMAAVLALLIGAYFIISAIADSKTPDEPEKTPPPQILDGEALYLNQAVAYPRLEEGQILSILVSNKEGTFDMTRWPDEKGCFWLGYDAGDGVEHMVQYIPPIVDAEGDFNYEDLYAIEMGDGYSRVYMLTYLCSALTTPYFTERIPVPKGDDPQSVKERSIILEEYGFTSGSVERVSFVYGNKDESGKISYEGTHSLVIGDRSLSGSGYYYMVDNRDYIYYTANNYFDYALMGFKSFVRGTLVAAGLAEDSTYEPYLTTDFKQWVNTLHKEDGSVITAGSKIVCDGEAIMPLNKGADYVPPSGSVADGYTYGGSEELVFDLDALRSHPDYERIKAILIGKEVGVYYDVNDPSANEKDRIYVTLINELIESYSKQINFGDKTSLTYSYTVTAIESVITPTGELMTEGTEVGEENLIKVTYYYSIDGKSATSLPRHAVIDLNTVGLPADAVSTLRGEKVGTLASPVTFDLVYTAENALTCEEALIISDIVAIYDAKGNDVDTVAENSYVVLRYYEIVEGVKSDKKQLTMSMADIEKDTKWDKLRAAIIGKGKGENMELKVYNNVYYYELLRDFGCYAINSIEYFVTSEIVASFRFCNASNRDPFYGESFYENTIDNKYKLYGLNASACEEVVKVLGGIGENSNSSDGLHGETVAVCLTHEVMDEYGLYAYEIYFELPRGLYDSTEGTEGDGEDVLSDFAWYDTLGFTLYISEEDYDDEGNKIRYVGSDMYDLVAKIPAEKLVFLKYGFVDFYARRNLVLMNVANLENVSLEFNMEDLYGDFNFDVNVKTVYQGYVNGKFTTSYEHFTGATAVDKFYVNASCSEDSVETELSKYLDKLSMDEVSVSALYNEVMGKGEELFVPGTIETVGVSNFKEAFELLQLTRYEGTLTEEEQQRAEGKEYIMKMQILIGGANSSSLYYTYEFYRVDDRKVMVSLYQTNADGSIKTTEVSDFYISTFSFKKLVNGFLGVLNAQEIDIEQGYPEEK